MLKNSSTLAVSVAINISMKLCFVSVNGPREPYLLDEPRILELNSFSSVNGAPKIPKQIQIHKSALTRNVQTD
jgi:hypothetical protein